MESMVSILNQNPALRTTLEGLLFDSECGLATDSTVVYAFDNEFGVGPEGEGPLLLVKHGGLATALVAIFRLAGERLHELGDETPQIFS